MFRESFFFLSWVSREENEEAIKRITSFVLQSLQFSEQWGEVLLKIKNWE